MAKQMDTTKAAIKKYLDEAAKDTKESYHAGETMKLAALRWILDCAGIADQKERAAIGQQWMAAPGWFGCGNNSACRQAMEKKDGGSTLAEYRF